MKGEQENEHEYKGKRGTEVACCRGCSSRARLGMRLKGKEREEEKKRGEKTRREEERASERERIERIEGKTKKMENRPRNRF